jgi:hypothetical protein
MKKKWTHRDWWRRKRCNKGRKTGLKKKEVGKVFGMCQAAPWLYTEIVLIVTPSCSHCYVLSMWTSRGTTPLRHGRAEACLGGFSVYGEHVALLSYELLFRYYSICLYMIIKRIYEVILWFFGVITTNIYYLCVLFFCRTFHPENQREYMMWNHAQTF